ncbi:MAG: hypothetical protein DHS20C21_06300 [Gemmatimonadota bacterium]|nr:MAG: hypothetical protein DHS20C21_06300 [Gemmatimonadota bacterium]
MALSLRGWISFSLLSTLFTLGLAAPSSAVCPETNLFNFTGPGSVVCPCFIPGEQAGAQYTLTPDKFPIEILRVGITWGSQFGGAPTTLEQAIHFYEGGLPDPGTPIFSLAGPQLTDGFINEFDLEAIASTVVVNSAPFSVTLEFLNSNAGSFFDPSVVHDGDGCQPGKNLVFAIPGGWSNSCTLGVTGDWVFFIVYREVNCAETGVAEEKILSSAPVALLPPQPNPFRGDTRVEFFVQDQRHVTLAVFDLQGRRVADLADRAFSAGGHTVPWDGRRADGSPSATGVYFVVMQSEDYRQTQKVTLTR